MLRGFRIFVATAEPRSRHSLNNFVRAGHKRAGAVMWRPPEVRKNRKGRCAWYFRTLHRPLNISYPPLHGMSTTSPDLVTKMSLLMDLISGLSLRSSLSTALSDSLVMRAVSRIMFGD